MTFRQRILPVVFACLLSVNQIRCGSYYPTLSVPRQDLTAAGLPGYIAFAGGEARIESADVLVDIVDIYDTVSGNLFTERLSVPRRYIASAAYGTKFFFAGGASESGSTDVVDIYDTATRNWTVAHLSEARDRIAAAVVGNKIIFAGGTIGPGNFSDVVDIYDPINDQWTVTHMMVPRSFLSAVGSSTYGLLVGGYVISGVGSGFADYFERFDPTTNQLDPPVFDFENFRMLIGSAQSHSPEELMIFAGGTGLSSQYYNFVDIFYPNGTRHSSRTLSAGRIDPAVACLPSQCYVAGGVELGGAEVFRFGQDTTQSAVSALSRAFLAGSFDQNDTIAFGGGLGATGLIDAIEVQRINPIPYAPYNLTIYNPTGSPLVILITWDANIAFTKNFTIERWSNTSPEWIMIDRISTASALTADILAYNTTYRYRVIAISSYANAYSEVAEYITPNIAPPPVPAQFSAVPSASAAILLTWSFDNDIPESSTVVIIERSNNTEDEFSPIASVLATQASYSDAELEYNVTYYYRAFSRATFTSNYTDIISALLPLPPSTVIVTPTVDTGPDVAQVVPGVIIPVVLVAVAVVVLMVLLRRGKLRKVKFFAKLEYLVFSHKALSLNIDLASTAIAERLRIPYSELTMIKQIGMGSYGEVYLGVWKQSHVAIKFCKRALDMDEFLREAEVMMAIRPHPNIVQVLGVSTDGPQIALVLEFCQGGSLDYLLFDTATQLSASQMIKLASGIAAGIFHLHQSNIVHRDLASRNVLLTGDNQPKIADFGMSRLLQTENDIAATKSDTGPVRWMAPESLKEKTYSTKSDVWSFGIVLFELVARSEPHVSEDLLQIGVKIRDEGFTPKIPVDCPHVLKDVMESCWKFDPAARPDFNEICNKLNAAVASL